MRKVGYAIIGFGGIAENRIAREGFGLDGSRFAGHPTQPCRRHRHGLTRRDAASRWD